MASSSRANDRGSIADEMQRAEDSGDSDAKKRRNRTAFNGAVTTRTAPRLHFELRAVQRGPRPLTKPSFRPLAAVWGSRHRRTRVDWGLGKRAKRARAVSKLRMSRRLMPVPARCDPRSKALDGKGLTGDRGNHVGLRWSAATWGGHLSTPTLAMGRDLARITRRAGGRFSSKCSVRRALQIRSTRVGRGRKIRLFQNRRPAPR